METGTYEKACVALHPLRSKIKEVAGMITDCPNRAAQGYDARIVDPVRVKIGQFNQFWGK